MNTTPATKTLSVELRGPEYLINKLLLSATSRARDLWLWLRSNWTGFKFEVEQIAHALSTSPSTIYRARTDLEQIGVLRVEPGKWRVVTPDCIIRTGDDSRDSKERAGIHTERKKEPTYSEKRSNVVEPTARNPVGMSETNGKTDKDRPQPVKAKPTNAPDHHDRDLVSCVDRVVIEKFLLAWAQEFRDGPNGRNLIVLPSAWQQRILWLWQYWTADELREAFIATRDAVPRKPWKYFCACLDKIAAGTWGEDGAPGADTVRYIGGASVDRDQDPDRLAEAKLEAADAEPPEPDDPDELAYRRGEITLDEWFKRRTARGNS